jgi:hypothetical protein
MHSKSRLYRRKLLGVVVSLFLLTASCGGGHDSEAQAPAAAPTCEPEPTDDDGSTNDPREFGKEMGGCLSLQGIAAETGPRRFRVRSDRPACGTICLSAYLRLPSAPDDRLDVEVCLGVGDVLAGPPRTFEIISRGRTRSEALRYGYATVSWEQSTGFACTTPETDGESHWGGPVVPSCGYAEKLKKVVHEGFVDCENRLDAIRCRFHDLRFDDLGDPSLSGVGTGWLHAGDPPRDYPECRDK